MGQLTIDQSDGELAAMSPATVASSSGTTLFYPNGGAIHPSGHWFYVTNNQNATVSQFTIGTAGALTSMVTSTITSPSSYASPTAVAVDPSGKYAYVASQIGNGTGQALISQYTIEQSTGALESNGYSLTGPSTYSTPFTIKIASIPSGEYDYVTNYQDGTIWQHKVQDDGTLASLGSVSTGGTIAIEIAVHPSGKYLYATVYTGSPSSVVAQFNIDQTDGTLSAMTPATVSAGGIGADSIAIDSSGRYAYVTSGDSGWGSTSIAQYEIDQTTGALALMTNPTVPTSSASGPSEIVVVGK